MHTALSTFAEKIDRLEASKLRKFLTESAWHVSWDFELDEPGVEARMPEREYLEAYVLNLRFFIQNNEPTSLRNIAFLYEEKCQKPDLIARFRSIRDVINGELDRALWFKFNEKPVTYRQIFMGMIYSHCAHAERN
jgi:hypothetical protein